MGGSIGKSKNKGGSSWTNNVWGPQGQALQDLYGRAADYLGQGDTGAWADRMGDVYDTISGATKAQAEGGAMGDSAGIRDRLFGMMEQPSQMGQMYQSIVGGQGNEYIDPLIERMRGDVGRNVSTLQNQNALDAAAMGQSGSSRQAMQNAMIASEANRNLMDKEAEMRAGGYDKDLAMKMGIAQQADQSRQAEQDRLYNMLAGINQSQQGATDASGNLMNMIMGGQNMGWNPLFNLANIIGAPTLVGRGSASSKGKGFGTGGGLW